MKRYAKLTLISILLCASFLIACTPIHAQETESVYPAEINARIHEIPSIKVTDWTTINITVNDAFGINWTDLKERLPIKSTYLWHIIHPAWRPFLGYSKLRFEPEIIAGDPRGWYCRVTPNSIPEADQGRDYKLKLEVKTDDIAVDYSVVIGIKVTRIDTNGDASGYSYINIPVKASSLNNIKMYTEKTTKTTGPKSLIDYNVEIANNGYYRDTFQIELEGENGVVAIANKQALVLEPNEKKSVTISVFTPEKFYDLGTPSGISVYVSSIADPERALVGELIVVTEGFYFSPLIFIVLAIIIIIILLLWQLSKFIKKNGNLKKEKPKKPKNKEKPKKKPKKEENNERLFSNFFNKPKKPKEEPIVEKPVEEKKPEPPKEEPVVVPKTEKKTVSIDKSKMRTIEKIKRQQEKQKRKMGD